MIANRLMNIKNSHRIILMNKRRIEVISNFLELINSTSKFKKMLKLQGITIKK